MLTGESSVSILAAFSPDFNPIEEFFSELKAFIRRHWQSYEEHPAQGFDFFLEWCINTVGAREQSAEGFGGPGRPRASNVSGSMACYRVRTPSGVRLLS